MFLLADNNPCTATLAQQLCPIVQRILVLHRYAARLSKQIWPNEEDDLNERENATSSLRQSIANVQPKKKRSLSAASTYIAVIDCGGGTFKRYLVKVQPGRAIEMLNEDKDEETAQQYYTQVKKLLKEFKKHKTEEEIDANIQYWEGILNEIIDAMFNKNCMVEMMKRHRVPWDDLKCMHFLGTSKIRDFFGVRDGNNKNAKLWIRRKIEEGLRRRATEHARACDLSNNDDLLCDVRFKVLKHRHGTWCASSIVHVSLAFQRMPRTQRPLRGRRSYNSHQHKCKPCHSRVSLTHAQLRLKFSAHLWNHHGLQRPVLARIPVTWVLTLHGLRCCFSVGSGGK